jgi:hypothetical protein
MTSSPRRGPPQLSKTRFRYGLQCSKFLWLECFRPKLADPYSEAQLARFESGTEVGVLARQLYPGGVLVEQDHFHIDEALAVTRRHLERQPPIPVFEAAFMHEEVRVRADIVAPAPDGLFDMLEVKSAGQLHQAYIEDVAIQHFAMAGMGVPAGRASIVHLNKDYIHDGRPGYRLNQLFVKRDVTGEVADWKPVLVEKLAEMKRIITLAEPPEVRPGKQCNAPFTCKFYGHCHQGEPEHPVYELPGAPPEMMAALIAAGVREIREIPTDYPGLTPRQKLVRDCVIRDAPHFDQALKDTLAKLVYPVHFLDFETYHPSLPIYRGTKPFQQVPFQWSDHVINRDGFVRHLEFLSPDGADPRADFARSLVEAAGREGSIVVYSAAEKVNINRLAEAVPELAGELQALVLRLVDLWGLVKAHVYHPAFHGSYSLKSVLPALVPDLDYRGLAIQEGDAASAAFAEMIKPGTPLERREEIRANLRAYCQRDTEALLRLFQVLR